MVNFYPLQFKRCLVVAYVVDKEFTLSVAMLCIQGRRLLFLVSAITLDIDFCLLTLCKRNLSNFP